MEYQESDGDKGRIVEQDLQSTFDTLFGTNASLAPGPLDAFTDRFLDASLEMRRDKWLLRLWGAKRDDYGLGAGVTQVLARGTSGLTEHFLTDLTYHDDEFTPNWDINLRLAHLYIRLNFLT